MGSCHQSNLCCSIPTLLTNASLLFEALLRNTAGCSFKPTSSELKIHQDWDAQGHGIPWVIFLTIAFFLRSLLTYM